MIVKEIRDEDFTNYKKPSMFIGFPTCTWKCEIECGKKMCQNKSLATSKSIDMSYSSIVNRYLNNNITSAVVIGGLEPFDKWEDLCLLIHTFRQYTQDDIVIYTGWYEQEIKDNVEYLRQNYDNIVIKFGRFIPNQNPHYDNTLGVFLASNNQYAERIS